MTTHAPEFPRDESLDPADPAAWNAYRALAHRALDEALDSLQTVGDRPVWIPVPDDVKAALSVAPPREPEGAARVYDDCRRLVLPYATGNIHPRFWGWVNGTGTVGGLVGELLTAAMNSNCGGRDHGAVYVERQVIDWCRGIFDFPRAASGLLVSGTSMGTLIGLTVARAEALRALGIDVRADGLANAPRLRVYASSEAHVSLRKALELLGLGRASLRSVPVDAAMRIDITALRRLIADDRAAGAHPFCIVATAGTVNTGAIDDLSAIAALCREERLWMHVDGAFGALIQLSPDLAPRLAGIECADSLAFDFHKWLHVPYDAGCVLIRDGDAHLRAFSTHQDYLASGGRGLSGGAPWFCDFGPELSRSFRALRVWFTLKEHGLRRLGEKIYENCEQARALAQLVDDDDALELAAPVSLNIVCFRYVGHHGASLESLEALDRLNEELVARLHLDGIAAPSTTRIGGRLVIRVAITNHRSRRSDFALLVRAVVERGRALSDG